MTQDRVTTLGTNVDGAVRRIGRTYDVRGMLKYITSYDNATVGSGSVVNDVNFTFNSFSQLTKDSQEHGGAVGVGTPNVQYAYDNGSANEIRLTSKTYPSGRVLNFSYGTPGGMNDVLSRLVGLVDNDGMTHLADYSYLGLGGVIETDYTEPDVKYTLVGTAGGNDPDTGDIYRGFDRFGRVKDAYWYDYGAVADAARIQYGYDRAGNRTYRADSVATAAGAKFEELYAYDGLQRLTNMQRGLLNVSRTTITNQQFAQCWTLDATGNWKGFREDANGDGAWDLVQARTSNSVNEISSISNSVGPSWANPAYDAAGNMTSIPQESNPSSPFSGTFDAWNRLVKLTDGANMVQENQYDGRRFRIIAKNYVAGVLSETRHYYYSSGWRVLEERLGASPNPANPDRQFVWGIRYIDDLVLRDRDTDGNGSLDERLYSLQDGNWNMIAVCNTSGSIQERYAYTAYGKPIFLSSGFVSSGSSSYRWETLYCGYYFDRITILFQVRNRFYAGILGKFISRDPLSYYGGPSLSEYGGSSPVGAVDPFGLLLIAIDGTSSRDWLENPCNPGKLANGRWLTHVANFRAEYKGESYYFHGPDEAWFGVDTDSILRAAHKTACESWCRTKEPIDIVGWSRGGFIGILLAQKLSSEGCNCDGKCTKNIPVRFLGLYDAVNKSINYNFLVYTYGGIPGNVQNCTQFYGKEDDDYQGVDRDTGGPWNNWPRVPPTLWVPAGANWHSSGINCTHGAIGGCPGYSGDEPANYDYARDVAGSISVDIQMRRAASKCGCPIEVISPSSYGFPEKQSQLPPVIKRAPPAPPPTVPPMPRYFPPTQAVDRPYGPRI